MMAPNRRYELSTEFRTPSQNPGFQLVDGTEHVESLMANLFLQVLTKPVVTLLDRANARRVVVNPIQIQHSDSCDEVGLCRPFEVFACGYWKFLREFIHPLEANNINSYTLSSSRIQPTP